MKDFDGHEWERWEEEVFRCRWCGFQTSVEIGKRGRLRLVLPKKQCVAYEEPVETEGGWPAKAHSGWNYAGSELLGRVGRFRSISVRDGGPLDVAGRTP